MLRTINKAVERLRSVSSRHRLPVWLALPYEAFVRAYARENLRSILKVFFKRKQPSRMIFVCGCYNSGTTIIKDTILLSEHVCGMPVEGDVLSSAFVDFEAGGWPRAMFGNKSLIEEFRDSGELQAEKILSDWRPWVRQGQVFLDKAIGHSVRIANLRKAFPGSRFVLVVRSQDGVCKGIQRRSVPAARAKSQLGSSEYPVEFLQNQWRFINSAALADFDGSDSIIVSYEDFVSDPKAECLRMFDFLDLPVGSVTVVGSTLCVGGRSVEVRGRGGVTSLPSDPEGLRLALAKA